MLLKRRCDSLAGDGGASLAARTMALATRHLPRWRGSTEQQAELLIALRHNCTCRFEQQARVGVCSAHRLLVEEQRVLDGLAFARSIVQRLRAEEFGAVATA
jgi:hypothetical protein